MYADSVKDIKSEDLTYYPKILLEYAERLEKYIDYLESLNKLKDENS